MMRPETDNLALLWKIRKLEERVDSLRRKLENQNTIDTFDTGHLDYDGSGATAAAHYVAADNATMYLTPLWLPGKIFLNSLVAYLIGNPSHAAYAAVAIYRMDRTSIIPKNPPPTTVVSLTTPGYSSLPDRSFSLIRAADSVLNTEVDGAPVSYPVRRVFQFSRDLELDPTKNLYAVAWQSFVSASASPRVVMWLSPNTWYTTTIGTMVHDASIDRPSWLVGYTPSEAGDFPTSLASSSAISGGSPTFRLLSRRATGVLIR